MFGKLEDVGQFASQAGKKHIVWSTPPPAEAAVMKAGVKLFTDRDYAIDEMPEQVRGLPFVRTSIEKIDVEVTKPGTLYALTPTPHPKADVPEVQPFPGEINRVGLWSKEVTTGEQLHFKKMVLLINGRGAEIKSRLP